MFPVNFQNLSRFSAARLGRKVFGSEKNNFVALSENTVPVLTCLPEEERTKKPLLL